MTITPEQQPEDPPSEWACPALYLLNEVAQRAVVSYALETGRSDNLGSYIGWLVERFPVYAHEMQGERLDIGNLENYESAEQWLSNERTSE